MFVPPHCLRSAGLNAVCWCFAVQRFVFDSNDRSACVPRRAACHTPDCRLLVVCVVQVLCASMCCWTHLSFVRACDRSLQGLPPGPERDMQLKYCHRRSAERLRFLASLTAVFGTHTFVLTLSPLMCCATETCSSKTAEWYVVTSLRCVRACKSSRLLWLHLLFVCSTSNLDRFCIPSTHICNHCVRSHTPAPRCSLLFSAGSISPNSSTCFQSSTSKRCFACSIRS